MKTKTLLKKILKGGEVEMKKILIVVMVVMAVVVMTGRDSFAALTQTINVTATVNLVTASMAATVHQVNSQGTCSYVDDKWNTTPQPGITFGTLDLDPVYNIFLPRDNSYYAVDVAVVDNSGSNWTVTQTRTDFKLAGGTATLNDNVNVVFQKVVKGASGLPQDDIATDIVKYSYTDSNNKAITKAQVSGGWLRILYGIGTGNTTAGCTDATGVTPITLDKPAGAYSGTVTLTLTP
ncbi:MAG: hypothetical protein HY761_04255 [Candidatus Omnitrophica bacterium]|nr:hypothetical protein [Candidatus Omnitrophota bacterium]